MALVNKPYTFTGGDKAVGSQVNANFDAVINDYNGNVTNANCSATMALADTKLAQITTAGKVSATAFTETSQGAGVVLGHDGTNWTSISASTQRFKPLLSMGSSCAARFEKINLASAAAFTGELPAANINTDIRAKAWVQFDGTSTSPAGTTLTIKDSYNVAGVFRNGAGKYSVVWDTAFANSSYAIVTTLRSPTIANPTAICNVASVTATSASLLTYVSGGAGDCPLVCAIAFGDQA